MVVDSCWCRGNPPARYPPGFNFEGDARTRVTPENIDSRARDFNKFARQKAAGYNTTSLLVPFGSDFQWANASINYENLDKLMAYVNANTDKCDGLGAVGSLAAPPWAAGRAE